MKFYYKGKLIRTSKTHNYTHAVMLGNTLISCASSYDLASKAYANYLNIYRGRKINSAKAMAALNAGQDYYINRRGDKITSQYMCTYEGYAKMFEEAEHILKNTHIVELEARA